MAYSSSLPTNLQFKCTHKTNVTVNFLDLLIHWNTERLDIDIQRKPIFTDTTIHFTSNHPMEQKLAAYRFLRNRMQVLILTAQSKHTEWNTILHIAKINGFPCSVISKLGVEWNVMNNGVEPFMVLMHVGLRQGLGAPQTDVRVMGALFL